ncbi:MAG: hypothetical protein HY372_01575 [Candidatus Andersenbacteria bacterium]|nr:hypothetical protein [Candidatus Andersenbacteria bacterium]
MSQHKGRPNVCIFDLSSDITGQKFFVDSHPFPHFDDLMAMFMIQKVGTAAFFEQYGTHLAIGIGGGPFDEHPDGAKRRKGRHSAATLVAQALGIDRDPAWRRLLNFSHFVDTGITRFGKSPKPEESNHPFDINNMLKTCWRCLRERMKRQGLQVEDDYAVRMVCELCGWLDYFLWGEHKIEEAQLEIAERGIRKEIAGSKGVTLKLVMITSDNPMTNSAARFYFAADIVVQRETRGNAHIFIRVGRHELRPDELVMQLGSDGCLRIFNREDMQELNPDELEVQLESDGQLRIFRKYKEGLCLDDLAQMVRLKEQMLAGKVQHNRWVTLRQEGQLAGERWFYFRPASNPSIQQLHNGTESFPDTPPTQITDEQLLEIITVAFDTSYFQPEYADDCRNGVCHGPKCPLYKWGLQRCRNIRQLQYDEVELVS